MSFNMRSATSHKKPLNRETIDFSLYQDAVAMATVYTQDRVTSPPSKLLKSFVGFSTESLFPLHTVNTYHCPQIPLNLFIDVYDQRHCRNCQTQ